MGVDRIDYVMWCVDVGYDNIGDYEDHLPEIEGQPGAKFTIVVDGMCGKYAMAGVVIASSDIYEGFNMIDITRELSNMDQYMEATALIKERFPHVDPLDFGIKIFSDYS
jgi:hypothetical protein